MKFIQPTYLLSNLIGIISLFVFIAGVLFWAVPEFDVLCELEEPEVLEELDELDGVEGVEELEELEGVEEPEEVQFKYKIINNIFSY